MGSLPSGVRRLLGQVIAVTDLERAIDSFACLGMTLTGRAGRADIGLDTATFGFGNGSYLELVTPTDPDAEVGGTVQAFLGRRGEGPYLTCFEVDDVFAAYERLTTAGIAVVGPPQGPPTGPGIACDVLWVKPRATAGAFMQLLSFRAPAGTESAGSTDGTVEPTDRVGGLGPRTEDMRLFTHVVTSADFGTAVDCFTKLGLDVWAEYQTELWGLQTAVFRLPDGSNLELVSPHDLSRSAAAALDQRATARGGHGHYMTVFEVRNVHALADQFERDGVPTLGRPAPAPPESPWGPCQQLWVHPRATHGAFIEFLTLPDGPTPAVGD